MFIKKIVLFVFISILFLQCSKLEIPHALKSSENYIELINKSDWQKIWENSSETYKKNYDYFRLLKLKEWHYLENYHQIKKMS